MRVHASAQLAPSRTRAAHPQPGSGLRPCMETFPVGGALRNRQTNGAMAPAMNASIKANAGHENSGAAIGTGRGGNSRYGLSGLPVNHIPRKGLAKSISAAQENSSHGFISESMFALRRPRHERLLCA